MANDKSSNSPPPSNGNPEVVNVPRPQAGLVQRDEFGAQVEQRAETATAAMAAARKAEIEARFIMARRFPRDFMIARDRLLKDCRRKVFAEVAIYRKPIGNDAIEGPSIRLLEAAVRALGNIHTETLTIYDDKWKRMLLVKVTDLEANLSYDETKTIEKTVERKKPKQGQTVVAQRQNSEGQVVFVVEATEDDLMVKQGAVVSKALRTQLQRVVPADLIEEAMTECYDTRQKAIEEDPELEKRRMCDAFSELGVSAAQLAAYLGHAIELTTVREMDNMKSIYTAIKAGELTWAAVLDSKDAADAEEGKPTTARGKQNLNDVTAKAKADREARAAAAAANKQTADEPIDLPEPGSQG